MSATVRQLLWSLSLVLCHYILRTSLYYAFAAIQCRWRHYDFRLSRCLLRSSVRSSGQILLPQYLMNALNNFYKTDRRYSLTHIDDLIRFWRSKVKCQGQQQVVEVVKVSTSTLGRLSSSFFCWPIYLFIYLLFVFLGTGTTAKTPYHRRCCQQTSVHNAL